MIAVHENRQWFPLFLSLDDSGYPFVQMRKMNFITFNFCQRSGSVKLRRIPRAMSFYGYDEQKGRHIRFTQIVDSPLEKSGITHIVSAQSILRHHLRPAFF